MSNIHQLLQNAHISSEPAAAAAASSVPLSARPGGEMVDGYDQRAREIRQRLNVMNGLPADYGSSDVVRHVPGEGVIVDRAALSQAFEAASRAVNIQLAVAADARARRNSMEDSEPEREVEADELAEHAERSGYNAIVQARGSSGRAPSYIPPSVAHDVAARLRQEELKEDMEDEMVKAAVYVNKIRDVEEAIRSLGEIDRAPAVSAAIDKDRPVEQPTADGVVAAKKSAQKHREAANAELVSLLGAIHKYSVLFDKACTMEYKYQHVRRELHAVQEMRRDDLAYAMEKAQRKQDEKIVELERKLERADRRNKRKKLGTDDEAVPSMFDLFPRRN